MLGSTVHVRRASVEDGEGIAKVLQAVVSERVHSAIDRAWTAEEQQRYLSSLSSREAFYVAISENGDVVGYQSLDLYSTVLGSMSHVAQLGTFLAPGWRRRGVGLALFEETSRFAASAGFRKIVIQVRASNASAQAFYKKLGFVECGRLRRQVVIDGREDDEVVMEIFLR